jgi:hypothetical protein
VEARDRNAGFNGDGSDSDYTCPCIVYINRNEAPRTFQEWVNATDVEQSLSTTAKSGRLRTVQIINRAVPTLPEELRHCRGMEQLYVGGGCLERKG